MEVLVAYLLVVGGVLMLLLAVWLEKRGALPGRILRTETPPSVRQVSLLLGATGVSAVISQLPVVLEVDAGTKLLLWFVSAPFLIVALVLFARIASARRRFGNTDVAGR